MRASSPLITKITSYSITFPLLEPFGVATRTAQVAKNILCVIASSDGTEGYGSCTPVEYITGETPESVMAAHAQVCPTLLGTDPADLSKSIALVSDLLPNSPAARAAVEMACIDLWGKVKHVNLWSHYGGKLKFISSDLTIPIVDPKSAKNKATRAWENGFRALKIKVGDSAGIDADMQRLEAVVRGAELASIRIDANQAFSASDACGFIREAKRIAPNTELLEQPVKANDLEGFCKVREVTQKLNVELFADESAQTISQVSTLLDQSAVDGINIKVMKSGLFGASEILTLAQSKGAKLMIGCMLEANLSLCASCALAAGSGTFDYIDLDSHRLLAPNDLYAEGFVGEGPLLTPNNEAYGFGVILNQHSQLLKTSPHEVWQ